MNGELKRCRCFVCPPGTRTEPAAENLRLFGGSARFPLGARRPCLRALNALRSARPPLPFILSRDRGLAASAFLPSPSPDPMKNLPDLQDVFWIGGSVCAGKSSMLREHAEVWGVTAYHFDASEREHLDKSGKGSSILERLPMPAARAKYDERWLNRSPEEMAERTIRSWKERFHLVLEDLAGAPVGRRAVAEGAGLFPDLIAPLLPDRGHGIWLVASPEFIRWARLHRGMTAPELTSDPERAAENIIERDILMADHVRHSAGELGLAMITVDGKKPLQEVAAVVISHFGFPEGSTE